MKISNNALNFLLAQYRAIFKRAYVKGIASAVLLTAGLAAGQAQAAMLDTSALPDTNETATITGDDRDVAPEYQYLQLSGTAADFNGTVDVTAGYALESGSGSQNLIVGVDASGTSITGTGTLNISIENAELNGSGQGVLVLGNSGSVSLDIGAINVNEGVLRLSASGSSGSGTVTVAADTINVGAEGATGKQALLSLSDSGSNAGVTLGRVASGSITGSEISVLGGGLLTMQGSGSSGASIVGNSLRIATGGVMLTDTGTKNTVSTDNFTVENGAFKVISGAAAVGETFQGHTATVQSGGNFLVGQSGTWTISDTPDTDPDNNNKAITTQVTFENGSNVQVNGQIVVSGGLLSIESGAGLYATAEGASGAGSIVVATRGNGTGLEIDSAVLSDFLTSGDTYNVITKDASGNHVVSGTASDKAGSILLSGGRLTFSDQDQVELSDFHFVSGTEASGGVIVVSGTNAIVGGHDISIAKALTKNGEDPTDIGGLHVTTDLLTLGDGTDTGLTKLSDSKVTKFTIRDGLNVNVKNNGFFTFDGAAESVSFINSDPNWTAEVNGNLEFTSSQRTPIKGQWVFNDDVKLTNTGDANNTLNIGPWNGNGTPANADKISYNTDVVFKGQIINNAANGGYVGILAQTNGLEGVETTVDFTQATLSSPNADSAGLLSLQAYDDAVMKFNGNQFDQILSASKSNGVGEAGDGFGLNANRGGIIEVTTPVTGEYDFSKFHAKQSGQTDGKYYEQQVTFDGAGVLDINGDLGLYTGNKNDDSVSGAALNIGEGTIKANQISLTNYHVTDEKKGTHEAVTLQSGTLEVSQGLTVKLSDTLNVGAAAGDKANIVLESDTLTGTGTLAVEKDVNLNGEGSIEVHQGAWSTTANIYAKGSSGLVLANANVNANVNADDLADGTYAASFVGKNFKAEGTGTAISAGAGTKATFDTMQLADTSSVVLDDGHLLVNGANVALAEGETKTDNPAYVNPDANKTSTTAGIAFGDADITVTGAQGVMEFGELATSKLLSLSGDTFTLVKGGIDGANFHVDDFGQLKFNFAENTKLNTKQISSLVNAVKVGDKNDTGYINLGNADLGLNFKDQENGTTTIAWDDLEDYVNVIGSAATSEKLMSAQVTDIAYTDKVKGHYGALSVVTTNNSLALNGPTSLHNAAAFGNNFAVNQNTGELIALRLENGADLNLANGGNVGAIEGGFDNDVIISNDADVAGPTTTTVAGGITRVDLLQVGSANDLVVQGNVEALELDVQGTFTNAATANSLQLRVCLIFVWHKITGTSWY